jgi:2-keto-4-pentenoate hydratase/2-oxohepta-3-ene-1,7-dioic acid hydratase in catechol pathway
MKLVTCLVGEQSAPQVGLVLDSRVLMTRELLTAAEVDPASGSSMVDFIQLPQATLKQVLRSGLEAAAQKHGYPLSSVRLLAPIPRPGKIIGLGYNYRALCEHEGVTPREEPELFTKLPTSVIGPFDRVTVPRVIDKVDFEAELGVVIGRYCRDVSVSEALEYVAGYTVVNDVTAKIIPRPPEAGSVVLALKGCDSFAPTGPCLVTRDEIPDPQNINILCRVNGEERQNFNTSNMVRTVAEVIAYISERITLEPGDILSTGTSLGIGIVQKPPVFLKNLDVVEIEIRGIGTICNTFMIPALR